MALQVDTVFIWVSDLDLALDWYGRIGFQPGPRYGTWQVIDVPGDTRFALHQGMRPEGPSTAVPSFRVDDLDREIERLGTVDILARDPVTDTGTARFTTFVDPDGNEIQLLER